MPDQRRALAGAPIEYDNVSSGGDLPVVIADPTTPGQKAAVNASGQLAVLDSSLMDSGDSVAVLLLALIQETARLRQGMVLAGQCEDVRVDELTPDYLI